jgi:alkanesulfonate monooxygenase SsuD/methylene tetrahydromethanopterin reductase-like flavin-dependent oxidoreductase (luciferase family)
VELIMRFGFFDQLPCADSQSESRRYEDILAQIELGDRLGFNTVWLGELHFGRSSSILACPLMVLAAAAQRTRHIRLGTAVSLLPLHSPVKMAEEAATADILSGGRLEFGVGRGTAPIHYTGYNVPMEESRERFEEALTVIREAWTHERLTYHGKCIFTRMISRLCPSRFRSRIRRFDWRQTALTLSVSPGGSGFRFSPRH